MGATLKVEIAESKLMGNGLEWCTERLGATDSSELLFTLMPAHDERF